MHPILKKDCIEHSYAETQLPGKTDDIKYSKLVLYPLMDDTTFCTKCCWDCVPEILLLNLVHKDAA